MDLVPLHSSIIWVNTSKLHIVAEIVATIATKKAVATGNAWFDSYPVAYS